MPFQFPPPPLPPPPPPVPPTVPQRVLGTLKFLLQFTCGLTVIAVAGVVGFLVVMTAWRAAMFVFGRFLVNPW